MTLVASRIVNEVSYVMKTKYMRVFLRDRRSTW